MTRTLLIKKMERIWLKQIRDPSMTPDTHIYNSPDLTVSQCAHNLLQKMSVSKKRNKRSKTE